MNIKARTFVACFSLLVLVGGLLLNRPATAAETVYIEPGLVSNPTEPLSVIVTAADSQAAAEAVEHVGGQVVSDLWLIEAVSARVPATRLSRLAAQPGIVSIVADKEVKSAQDPMWDGWVTSYNIPVPYDGSPDAQPTYDNRGREDMGIWELVNPISLDVGADIVHVDRVTGKGVGIAILDSGIYYEPGVLDEFDRVLNRNFFGQVDFVGDGSCPPGSGRDQYDGYCYSNRQSSYDGYGHGSHITGLIWNNIIDQNTGVKVGIAPDAEILSVRVLGTDGTGTYTDVIEGIQYVVDNKYSYNTRVMNLSLSAHVTTPYFVDPINRAAEAAWANGIVVVAAAGNLGGGAESITVPGNDPYVITVGSVGSPRTPGYWGDDYLTGWSSTGPTWDGFAKPDVLAPGTYAVSFMYNDPHNMNHSDVLVQQHPDNVVASTLFRMSGTSQSTAVASGVVALMLDQNTSLSPDQVKYRLMVSGRPALANEATPDLVYNILQQGMGRIWAPEAVFGDFPADGVANAGMDILADLNHDTGWVDANGDGLMQPEELDPNEMAYHYSGRIGRVASDDGQAYLYYLMDLGPGTVRDEFNAVSYSNNDGSATWSGNWTELNDDSFPTSGEVTITTNRLRMRGVGNGAWRSSKSLTTLKVLPQGREVTTSRPIYLGTRHFGFEFSKLTAGPTNTSL
jgi:serine protease AprX